MIVSITGHRPDKIPSFDALLVPFTKALHDLEATGLIQGCANGVDLWSAQVAHNMGIPFICARPWRTHTPRKDDRELYDWALENCYAHHFVHPATSYPGAWVYQRRNEWMVDRADCVLAIWDGSEGGTANCVRYADKSGKPVTIIDPVDLERYDPETVHF